MTSKKDLRLAVFDFWPRFRPELMLIGLSLIIIIISLIVFSFISQSKPEEIVFSGQGVETELKPERDEAKIVIDIQGAVQKPGAYEVTAGARLKDLIVLAEGLSAAADRDFFAQTFNLAKVVSDEEKIYIPSADEVSQGQVAGVSQPKADGKINLNQAGLSQLEGLPGIGPVTAQKIIDNRPYSLIEDLLTKKVVGKNLFEKIKDKISVN